MRGSKRGTAAAQEEVQTRTTIGIEGRVYLEHEGRPLQAVEAREDALLLLRIGEVEDLGDNRQRVELLFLARRAGDFDLSDALRLRIQLDHLCEAALRLLVGNILL